MALALSVPVGCARLRASTAARVRPTVSVSANLAPPRGDAVDWVAGTSSFFEQDSRPIMLYDGKAHFSTLSLVILSCSQIPKNSKHSMPIVWARHGNFRPATPARSDLVCPVFMLFFFFLNFIFFNEEFA